MFATESILINIIFVRFLVWLQRDGTAGQQCTRHSVLTLHI